MIIPRLKRCAQSGRKLDLGSCLRIYYADEVTKRLAFAAKELLCPISTVTSASQEDAQLIITCGEHTNDPVTPCINRNKESICFWEQKGHYTIHCTQQQIHVNCSDFSGGRNGLATLSQLLAVENGRIIIPEVNIADEPDASFRSFMHDVGRKYIPIAELKMHILLLAKCKMNVLHFHFTEYVGFAIALSEFPELKGPKSTGGLQYTEQEILDLVAYAESLGIEVIPEIDLPGHANSITDAYPVLKCKPTDGRDSHGWALCVGAKETYFFLEKLISAVSKLFKSRYFHIGTDEISMEDVIRTPLPLSDWNDCLVCRALAQREGYQDQTQLFYYFVNRVYSILQKQGKRMIMWNDQIDVSVSPDLPRDILIEFWRVAAPNRGPVVGCSMQRFLEEGFDVINANFPDTYIDLYVEYDNLKQWDYRRHSASDRSTPGQIIGGDVCAWDVFPHFSHSVPISIPCFADRFWNREAVQDEEAFLSDISEILLGIPDFNLFQYTKEVLYLNNDNEVFRTDADRKEVQTLLASARAANPITQYMQQLYLTLSGPRQEPLQ